MVWSHFNNVIRFPIPLSASNSVIDSDELPENSYKNDDQAFHIQTQRWLFFGHLFNFFNDVRIGQGGHIPDVLFV